jgi:hypothetical protein
VTEKERDEQDNPKKHVKQIIYVLKKYSNEYLLSSCELLLLCYVIHFFVVQLRSFTREVSKTTTPPLVFATSTCSPPLHSSPQMPIIHASSLGPRLFTIPPPPSFHKLLCAAFVWSHFMTLFVSLANTGFAALASHLCGRAPCVVPIFGPTK